MDNKSIYLSIKIPVITLRVILIVSVIFLVSIGGLLPFSFLSFNCFYGYLIPTSSIHLPLSKYILNYDFHGIPPFIIIGKRLDPLYVNQPRREEHHEAFDRFNFNLNYDFILNFDAFCLKDNDLKYESIMYKISIVSNDLVNQLSPYGTKPYVSRRSSLWPVTNNIHQLHNPQILVSAMNTFILDCNKDSNPTNEQSIPFKSLLPPVFEWVVPKVVQDFKVISKGKRFSIDLFKDLKFKDYITPENIEYFTDQEFNILLEFNNPKIVIDPSNSEIMIHTSWKGLNYYLYHYKFVSYILGVSILWLGSSLILLVTIGALVIWREINSKDEEPTDSKIDEKDETSSIINQNLVEVNSTTERELE